MSAATTPFAGALLIAALCAATAANSAAPDLTHLPEPVASTFHATFAGAEVEKLDSEQENGVVVYDFEFRQGATEQEADIAADGTLLESTLVIAARDVPDRAMRAIRQAARGAKLGRIERVQIAYQTRDGKVVRLPESVTHYAVEMTRQGRHGEIVVLPNGTVVEAPRWTQASPEHAAADSLR